MYDIIKDIPLEQIEKSDRVLINGTPEDIAGLRGIEERLRNNFNLKQSDILIYDSRSRDFWYNFFGNFNRKSWNEFFSSGNAMSPKLIISTGRTSIMGLMDFIDFDTKSRLDEIAKQFNVPVQYIFTHFSGLEHPLFYKLAPF